MAQKEAVPTGAGAGSAKETREAKKKTLQQRVDDWNVSPVVLDNLINVLIALLVFFILLALALFGLALERHILSIIMVPLLIYFALSLPSFKLRMREYPSSLLISDAVALVNLAALCLYMDFVFYGNENELVLKLVFSLIGVVMFTAYLGRWYYSFYITPFFAVVYNVFFLTMNGVDTVVMAVLLIVMFFLFLASMWRHKFYFGIGRVCVAGKYVEMPELKASYVRKKQKINAKKQRREAENAAAEKK